MPSVGGESMTGSHQKRLLGFWMALALVIGNIIGAGIFLLPATLRRSAGTRSTAGC